MKNINTLLILTVFMLLVTIGGALAAPKSITVTSPATGNMVHGTENVSWTISGSLTTPYLILISTNNGSSFTQIGTSNSLSFLWNTANGSFSDGKLYKVEISDSTTPNPTTGTSGTFTVDNTAPTTSDSAGAYSYGTWTTSNVIVTLTPSDATSGIASTKYCTDAVNTCNPSSGTSYTTPVTISTEGTTYFRYSSTDNAGNVQSTVSRTINIDKTAPIVTVPANNTNEATSASGVEKLFSVSANDNVAGSLTPLCSPASGSTFALGTTQVTCSATDSAGNVGSASFFITVVDTSAPIINSHADVTANATSQSGANVIYTSPATSDDVDGAGTATCSPVSGSTFAFGTNQVTCNAVDVHGNHATQTTFNVIVQDSAPVIIGVSDQALEASSSNGNDATFTPSAVDAIDGAVAVNCDAVSGSTFPIGVTQVNCSATDSNNNVASLSFTITVQDTTAPQIVGTPSDQILEATSNAGETFSYSTPTATDVVDVSDSVSCDVASGSAFAFGVTQVNCTSTDAHSNTATSSFTVTVQDTTIPVITLLGNDPITLNFGDTYTDSGATASDNIDGDLTSSIIITNPVDTALVGIYDVLYDIVDAHGNHATQVSRTVNVVDTVSPSITAPSDVVMEATGSLTSVSLGSPITSDNTGVAPTVTSDAPASFPVGNTIVTWTATDASGNNATAVQSVTITDTTPATIDPHTDVTVEATSPSGANAIYTSPATTDLVDGAGTATCTPLSATSFTFGNTLITCTSTDAHSNAATPVTFTMHVVDTTAPVITLNGNSVINIEQNGAFNDDGAIVSDNYYTGLLATATGTVDVATLGSYDITYNAVDGSGNHAIQVSRTVNVVTDATPPTISGFANPSSPNGNNGWYVSDVNVNFDCSDANSGVASCGPNATLSTDGSGQSVLGTAMDNAGNTNTATVSAINIDMTPPATANDAPAGLQNSDVTVTLSPTDALSGVASTAYCVDQTNTCTPSTSGTSVIVTAEGTNYVRYSSTDNAGNVESTQSVAITLDKTSATLVANDPLYNAILNASPLSITVTANEDVNLVSVSVDGSDMTSFTNATGSTIVVDTSSLSLSLGKHNVTVDVNDLAGNPTNYAFSITLVNTTINTEALNAGNSTINATDNAGVSLDVATSGSTTIFITPTTQPLANAGVLGLGKFVEITASNPSAVIFPVTIHVYYTPADVATAGIAESTLKLYYFNTTSNTWQVISTSTVDTTNHVLTATLSHFSTYGAYGSAPSAPAPNNGGNGGGNGGGGGALIVGTPSQPVATTPTTQPATTAPTTPAQTNPQNTPASTTPATTSANTPASTDNGITGAAITNVPKGTSSTTIAIIILAAVVVIAVGGYIYFRKKTQSPPSM